MAMVEIDRSSFSTLLFIVRADGGHRFVAAAPVAV